VSKREAFLSHKEVEAIGDRPEASRRGIVPAYDRKTAAQTNGNRFRLPPLDLAMDGASPPALLVKVEFASAAHNHVFKRLSQPGRHYSFPLPDPPTLTDREGAAKWAEEKAAVLSGRTRMIEPFPRNSKILLELRHAGKTLTQGLAIPSPDQPLAMRPKAYEATLNLLNRAWPAYGQGTC